jgi:hypothetical protein
MPSAARRGRSPVEWSREHLHLRAEDVLLGTGSVAAHYVYSIADECLTERKGRRGMALSITSVLSEVRSVFLPAGYPQSVRAEYLTFQAYDTLQAACSYLRSILTTSAILRGAGVGEGNASPMAAAVTWVLRDGVGMFGSLLFSYAAGANFDANVKEWRLFADLINDVGMTLDLLAPLAPTPAWFMVVGALGAACKTICGMVAGATRASITAHFAREGNLADVSAKEGAQETAVTLVGLVAGSGLASAMGDSVAHAWLAFAVLTAVHVWANCRGVGCLTFDTVNPQRAVLLSRAWCVAVERRAVETPRALAPAEVAASERFLGPLLLWLRGPRFGVSIGTLLDQRAADGGATQLYNLNKLYANEQYLMRLDYRGVPHITLKPDANGETILKVLLQCAALEHLSSDAWRSLYWIETFTVGEMQGLQKSLSFVNRQWATYRESLIEAGWAISTIRVEHFSGPLRLRIGSID